MTTRAKTVSTVQESGDRYEGELRQLSKCKPSEYVRLSNKPNAATYVKGNYDRARKGFYLCHTEDCNSEVFRKSTTLVYIGFTY